MKLVLLALGMVVASCVSVDRKVPVTYDEVVILESSGSVEGRGLSIYNDGPGTVEVRTMLYDGLRHESKMWEGQPVTFVLAGVKRIEIRHPQEGEARIRWSTTPELMDRISVEAD